VNEYIGVNMRRIAITQGLYTVVDDRDYDLLFAYIWCAQVVGKTYYAKRAVRVAGRFVPVLMHHCIVGMPTKRGAVVQHINGDGLDNRRANLRIVTRGTASHRNS
jgi:hypothetical protein